MDDEKLGLVLDTLIEYTEDDRIEFIRKNMSLLKELSAILYESVLDIDPREEEYDEYYSTFDSIKIAREFIEFINPNYLKDFDKFLIDGSFDIISESEEENDDGYVDVEILDDGKIRNSIHIPLKHNLDDVYAIVHEFFHTTNIGSFENIDRDLLTESVSIFYEFVLHDYLRNKNVNQKDNDASINFRLNQLLDDSYSLNFELDDIYDALDSMNLDYKKHSTKEIDEYYEDLISDVNYFVSSLIAIIKYYEYKKGYIRINQFERFNESLKREDGLNSLNYIFIKDISEEDIKEACEFIKNELSNVKGMKR